MKTATPASWQPVLTNEDWIAFLFDRLLPGTHPVSAVSELHPEQYPDTPEGNKAKGRALKGQLVPSIFGVNYPDYNTYLNCASFKSDESGYFEKKKPWYGALHAVMIDDVGTKVDAAGLAKYPPPTMKLETSEGNFQWWYKLDPPIPDYDIAKMFVAAMVRAVPNDGAGPSRWGRLPVGYNTKRNFRHRVTEFNAIGYDPGELTEAFGLVMVPEPERKAGIKVAGADAIAEWLSGIGLVKAQGHGWLEITCPWSSVITPGGHDNSTGTKYFLPSEGFPNGGFKCQHLTKCGHRNIHDLLKWCERIAGRLAA